MICFLNHLTYKNEPKAFSNNVSMCAWNSMIPPQIRNIRNYSTKKPIKILIHIQKEETLWDRVISLFFRTNYYETYEAISPLFQPGIKSFEMVKETQNRIREMILKGEDFDDLDQIYNLRRKADLLIRETIINYYKNEELTEDDLDLIEKAFRGIMIANSLSSGSELTPLQFISTSP